MKGKTLPPATKAKSPSPAKPKTVTITIPIGPPPHPGIHVSRHLEIQLNDAEKILLRRIWDALRDKPEKLPDDRFVNRPPDVVRWLLAQVANAIDE